MHRLGCVVTVCTRVRECTGAVMTTMLSQIIVETCSIWTLVALNTSWIDVTLTLARRGTVLRCGQVTAAAASRMAIGRPGRLVQFGQRVLLVVRIQFHAQCFRRFNAGVFS